MNRTDLFNKLIELIQKYSIPYAIVGRTEGYPTDIGSDIDIVIPRNRISDFQRMIWEFDDDDTKVVQMFQHEIVAFYYVVFHFDGNNRIYIQPDVCTDYYRNGRLLLTADFLLTDCKKSLHGDFCVLSSEKEFIYYLLKKIDKRNLSKEQFEHIRHSYLENREAAQTAASTFWTSNYLYIIFQSLDNNDYELMNSNLKNLQDGIHSSHKKHLSDVIKNLYLKINRIIKPTGFIIAVMGPDGSGKTTVINQFKKDIEPAFRRIQQFHLFPIQETGLEQVNKNPHEKKERGFLLSCIKLIYFDFIYILGHLKFVFPKKIRSTLTIYDRYFDDILVDPIRYRNRTPQLFVKISRLFIYKPELWFFLDCPTNIIQARKSEVSPKETERQRNAYLSLAKTKKRYIILNTNRDIKEISIEACRFFCDILNQRAIKRYKR